VCCTACLPAHVAILLSTTPSLDLLTSCCCCPPLPHPTPTTPAAPVLPHLSSCGTTVAALAARATQLRSLSLSRYDLDSVTCVTRASQLTSLALQCCSLQDSGLKGLGQLTKLRRLDLSDNSITAGGLPELTSLKDLVSVASMMYVCVGGGGRGRAGGGGLTVAAVCLSTDAPGSLPAAACVSAHLCDISSLILPFPVCSCPQTHLDLSVMPSRSRMRGAHMSDISALTALTALAELNLVGFGAADVTPLGGLGLHTLELGLNPLDGGSLRALGHITSLQHLELAGGRRSCVCGSNTTADQACRDFLWFGTTVLLTANTPVCTVSMLPSSSCSTPSLRRILSVSNGAVHTYLHSATHPTPPSDTLPPSPRTPHTPHTSLGIPWLYFPC
jgi:hypothetical protein